METLTRREWLGAAVATLAVGSRGAGAESQPRFRVGMCDWALKRQDVSSFELAKEIGLDAVQVSIGNPPDDLFLRDLAMQKKYLAASKATGVAIAGVAMGMLNHVAFMSEPKTALWTADTIEVTRNLGTRVILLAFFPPNGELKAENKEDMRRTVETLKELAPRAEKAGVILGLENYLTAEANLSILDQVKSDAVQVYYDVMNSASKDHDYLREIKMLGGKRICQVHVKEEHALLGSGKIDWPAVSGALKGVGYKGWIILETSSPNDVLRDTRVNLEYARKVFAALA